MDFRNMKLYPELFIDAAVFAVVAAGLIILSKCLWDLREERRLKKELAAHQQRREDEEQEEG